MQYQDNLGDYIESSFFIFRRFILPTTDVLACKKEYDRITQASLKLDKDVNKSQLRRKILNKIRHNETICGYETAYCSKDYKESLADFNYIENELVHGFVRAILHKSIDSGRLPKFPGLNKATPAFYLYYTKEVIWYCSETKTHTKQQLAEDLKTLAESFKSQVQTQQAA